MTAPFFWLQRYARRTDSCYPEAFERMMEDLEVRRHPLASATRHPLYRAQAERWLECLVRNDVTRVDGVLDSRFVYAQVFTGSGAEHGIIDVLTITRTGRHAVLESKASEHIHLSLQAADYWLRVRRHLELGEFRSYGRVWKFKTCRHWFIWSLPPCVSIR